jgi:hypothetical protein
LKQNSHLYDFTEQYFEENNKEPWKWNFFGFYVNKFIPPKKLEKARRVYASYNIKEEIPLMLIDDTVLFNSKRGMLITNVRIYYRLYPVDLKGPNVMGKIELKDTKEMVLTKFMDRAWVLINGHKVGVLIGVGGPPEGRIEILNDYFDKLLQEIHQNF